MNKRTFLFCILALAGGWSRAAEPGNVVQSATSNDIWALAGNGDTLWMITAGGVNFAIDRGGDSLSWWGYKTDRGPLALNFGGGRALVCLGTADETTPNDLWWYDHGTGKDSTHTIPFNRSALATFASDTAGRVVFYSRDLARDTAYYWLAFQSGGLVRWDHGAKKARVYSVGQQGSVASDSFPRNTDTTLLDTARRVLSVDIADPGTDSQRVYVATPRRVWRFSPADSSWDTLSTRFADPGRTSIEWYDVTVNNRTRPAGVFAFVKTNADSLMLYKYGDAGVWVRVVADNAHPYSPSSLSFGLDGRMYTGGDRRYVYRFADSAGTTRFPQKPTDGGTASPLDKRLDQATDVNLGDRVIQDVLCTVRDTVQRLWIATADGLYYSRNEVADETATPIRPFRFYRRAPRVAEGLKSAYVFPGVLSNQTAYLKSGEWQNTPHAVFAYNLGTDAKVTIRIYDYNMDLVKTVIDRQSRLAGSKRQAGRSTEPAVDFWDGTNISGRIVAPGVYYYRISTDKGDRAMGRIVVALQR